jgi:hypothetical protein
MTRRASQRRVALLGVFTILFHALLFGWHHHPLPLSAHSAQPTIGLAKAAPLSPATAEDGCEICVALHHLSAAPGEFFAAILPGAATPVPPLPSLVFAAANYRLACARGPPVTGISA